MRDSYAAITKQQLVSEYQWLISWVRLRLAGTWQHKGPIVLLLPCVIAWQTAWPSVHFLHYFLLAVVTFGGFIALGYLSNDLADLTEDKKATKNNLWEGIPQATCLKAGLGMGVVAFAPWYFLPTSVYSYSGVAAELALLVMYAFPPLRLKEHRYLSVVLDAMYAYTLPCLLAGYTCYLMVDTVQPLAWLLWGGWTSLLGIRHYLNHLCLDRLCDRQSGRHTLSTQYGTARLRNVITRLLLPVEVLLLCAAIGYNHLATPHVGPILLGLISGAGILTYCYYTGTRYRFTYIFIDKLYHCYLPTTLLLLCSLQDLGYVCILCLYYLLFYPRTIQHPLWQTLRKPCATAVNYGIYYFRRYVQVQNEQQARRAHYTHYLKQQTQQQKSQTNGCIAIINQHKKKYTETFIWEELDELPFGVHYLHGALLPRYVGDGTPLLAQHAWQATAYQLLAEIQGKSADHYLEKAICRFLIRNKIRALLVHFGPAAVRMLPISQATGLPLIAYLHGYDVHHKKVRTEHQNNYKKLFQQAALLLCASEDIRQQLLTAGAPEQKLHTLPAYVKLPYFTYSDHSTQPPHLLFVGRFCETKSPHLLLVAFAKLLKQLPKARLTLIGHDGGGELFEACLILTKGLRISNQVHFLGIRTHKEVAHHMQKARALVQPSVTTPIYNDREGTPVAILEACATGLPVVATKHAGIMEKIKHNKNGLLVEEYDITGLTQAMYRICTDHPLAKRLGYAAAQSMRKDPHIHAHTKQLYRHILNIL